MSYGTTSADLSILEKKPPRGLPKKCLTDLLVASKKRRRNWQLAALSAGKNGPFDQSFNILGGGDRS